MLERIITQLGDNYKASDSSSLSELIDKVTTIALSISNNKLENVQPEIESCVITLYLQRGAEDVSARTEAGIVSHYKDAIEEMRNNIMKNGKRRLY